MAFDVDRDGDIDFDDLVAAVKGVLDEDKDGQLTIEDFQRFNKDGDKDIDYNDYRLMKLQGQLKKKLGKEVPGGKILAKLIEYGDDIFKAIT